MNVKKLFLLLDFKTLSSADLLVKANVILAAMTGNLYFPYPVPDLATLEAAIKQFSASLTLSIGGEKQKVAAKNTSQAALVALLAELKGYIEFEAKGDALKLGSCGYTVSSDVKKPRKKGDIKDTRVVQGENSGELLVRIPVIAGTMSRSINYGPAPIANDSWKVIYDAANETVIKGLPRGTEISVRAAVKLKSGKTVFSPVINIIVT